VEDWNPVVKLWGHPLDKSWPPELTSSFPSIDFSFPKIPDTATEASCMGDRNMVGWWCQNKLANWSPLTTSSLEMTSVVTVSKILLSVGFSRFLQEKPRFSVRFLSVPFSPYRQCGMFMLPTAHQTCSSTLHISVYNSSRQQQVPNSVWLVAWKPPPVPNVARCETLLVWQSAPPTSVASEHLYSSASSMFTIKHNLSLISFKYWVLSTWNRSLACCA